MVFPPSNTLYIYAGVQLEDGGAYSCSVLDSGKYAAKMLEVYRKFRSAEFII